MRSGRTFESALSELKKAIDSDTNLSQSEAASKLGCTQRAKQYKLELYNIRLISKLGQCMTHDLSEFWIRKKPV